MSREYPVTTTSAKLPSSTIKTLFPAKLLANNIKVRFYSHVSSVYLFFRWNVTLNYFLFISFWRRLLNVEVNVGVWLRVLKGQITEGGYQVALKQLVRGPSITCIPAQHRSWHHQDVAPHSASVCLCWHVLLCLWAPVAVLNFSCEENFALRKHSGPTVY